MKQIISFYTKYSTCIAYCTKKILFFLIVYGNEYMHFPYVNNSKPNI